MTALLAGLALGAAGSAHCLGMCGPLVLAIGRPRGGTRAAPIAHLALYHVGRSGAYVVLGLAAGLAGSGLALAGFGRALAIACGVGLLAAAPGRVVLPRRGGAGTRPSPVARAAILVSRWSETHPLAGPLAAGALNGLLPCGLTYAALAAALALGSAVPAAILMAGFGAGTAPALVGVALSGVMLSPAARARLRPLRPVALAIAGALLIVRGATLPH